MKNNLKRMLCLLLTLLMLVSSVPLAAAYSAAGEASAAAQKETAAEAQKETASDTVTGIAEDKLFQATVSLPSPADKFKDVKRNAWYYNAVVYVTENGFFSGTSDETFEPSAYMSRAMAVTVLGRMAGIDIRRFRNGTEFTDVKSGSWYEPYVAWATRYGIVSGTGNGEFSPNTPITRQELAAFFVRYFRIFGVPLQDTDLLTSMPDDEERVADWAYESVQVLWARSMMVGDGTGNFQPRKRITRAECAQLAMTLFQATDKWHAYPGTESWRPVTPGGDGFYTVTFLNEQGGVITQYSVPIGQGIADADVPYYADPDPDYGIYFWGWTFDDYEGRPRIYNNLYAYNTDMTVQALCITQAEYAKYVEDQSYIISGDVTTEFTVVVRPKNKTNILDIPKDAAIYSRDNDSAVIYYVTPLANGDFMIGAEGYEPGGTYAMSLNDNFNFVVEIPDEDGVLQETELADEVRYIQYHIYKPVNAELIFREDIFWIPLSTFESYDPVSTEGYGTVHGLDEETAPGTGSFVCPAESSTILHHYLGVYNNAPAHVTCADGTEKTVSRVIPTLREYEESYYFDQGFTYADVYGGEDTTYLYVTNVDDNGDGTITCSFRELESDELSQIFYIPDVIPFRLAEMPDGTIGAAGTVDNYSAYDYNLYYEYSGNQAPNPRLGDFVLLYTDEIDFYGEDDFELMRSSTYTGEEPYVYGKITSIEGKKLTYSVVSRKEVEEAVNYFENCNFERYIPEKMIPEFTEEQMEEFEAETEELLDEEALRAFVFASIETDAESGDENAQQALEILQTESIAYRQGKLIGRGYAPDDSKRVEITGKQVAGDFTKKQKYLKKADGKWHICLDMGVMLIVKLRLNSDQNMYYVISANVTQEFCFGITAGGNFAVKWYLCVPVPTDISVYIGGLAETATDVTMDVRRYIVDKTYYGQIYGKYEDSQTIWNQFQEFLLCDAFVAHGASLYAKEAKYESLVSDADGIPADRVDERTKAEQAVRDAATSLNGFWNDKNKGLDAAWNKYFAHELESFNANQAAREAAEIALQAGGDKLMEEVLKLPDEFGFMDALVDDVEKKTDEAIKEAEESVKDLLDEEDSSLNATISEEELEALLEGAKVSNGEMKEESDKEKKKEENPDIVTYLEKVSDFLSTTSHYVDLVITVFETTYNQLVPGTTCSQTVYDRLGTTLNLLKGLSKLLGTVDKGITLLTDLSASLVRFVDLMDHIKAGEDSALSAMDIVYSMVKELNKSSKSLTAFCVDLKNNYFEKNSGNYNRCEKLATAINEMNDVCDWLIDKYDYYFPLLLDDKGNFTDGSTTDGDRSVPRNSKYWVFRSYRISQFNEFSLNTEIVKNLNAPDEGLNDSNIKHLVSKYKEMIDVTNSWMDLYRKPLISDIDITLFPGLDVTSSLEFVVQANINVAANFNFHMEYGKEFQLKLNLLKGKVTFDTVDRTNQTLSVRAIAMGELGFRFGFEVGIGLKIIKIFTVQLVGEIMPYVTLYGYMFFDYTMNLTKMESVTKLKGAMYIDVGIHFGLNLALSVDIIIYKNTWKFRVLTGDLTIVGIGDKKNVYNFGYNQPSRSDVTAFGEDADIIMDTDSTEVELSKVNTSVSGVLIVNSATEYKLPAAARMMSYMEMTTGDTGKSAFPANRFNYTFFRVPVEGDGITYEDELNLPVDYKMEEVVVKDKNGNIVYKENDGNGVPIEITVDADKSSDTLLVAANKGTPVTEWKKSNKVIVDYQGIESGKYVEDTRFRVDSSGRITFTPEPGDEADVLSEEVYVYITWKEGTLEFSNYPLRRVLHIIWSNEDPVSWVNAEVAIEDEDKSQSVVWNKTVLRGFTQVRIPGVKYILDICDCERFVYDEDQTFYVGEYSNAGTVVQRPQESFTAYIQAVRKTYNLEVRGYNADGSERVEYYPAKFGQVFPVPESFTKYVDTVDEQGHPQFLTFSGYAAMEDDSGGQRTWIYDYEQPLNAIVAWQLSESVDRYLQALYDDDTVKATFTFVGADREDVVQYLRRGTAPDEQPVAEVIEQLKTEAAAAGYTLNAVWSSAPGILTGDMQYVIDCRTRFVHTPTVTETGNEFEVKLSCAEEETLKEGDSLIYGFVPEGAGQVNIRWLPLGVNTAVVEPGIQYYYFSCMIDGETLERVYSSATPYTVSGERHETGYTTTLTVASAAGNPTGTLKLDIRLKYSTGALSDPVSVTLDNDTHATLVLSSLYSPDLIASIQISGTDINGEAPAAKYKISVSGESSKGNEYWYSNTATVYVGSGSVSVKTARLTFTMEQ